MEYDLAGQGGIGVWSSLPVGTKIQMLNGAVGEVTANPRDGSWLLVKWSEHPETAKVGEEEYVFFNEVKGASS